MKKYIVNVNGSNYEISLKVVEENEIKNAVAPAAVAPAAPAAPAPVAPQATAPQGAAPAGGEKIECPMPGTILSVNVSKSDTVKKGQVLMVLEAMKMENEIMAPCDGTVTFVGVSNGSSVETGTVLCVIE